MRKCMFCGQDALARSSRCADHQLASAKTSGWKRASSTAYGAAWQKIRREVLASEPVCAVCGIRPSRQVDHILPRVWGGGDERSNLRGICVACHKQKTNAESNLSPKRREKRRRTVDA